LDNDSTRKPRLRKAAQGRPKKPYANFPLSPHASGAWQKKILGKIYYFGRWARRVKGELVRVEGDGWKEALEQYKAVADDLHAGRTPRVKDDGLQLADLCNRFLTAKLRKVESGELSSRMFAEYREMTDLLVGAFGQARRVDDLAADDFESLRVQLTQRWGPTRTCNGVTRVKSVFKYGYESGLIDRPVRYGPQFKKPSASVLRRHRAQGGEKMLEADELRRLIDAAAGPLKAMILLGLNAGFGNADCANLPLAAVDLDGGWVDFPRPKTGIGRRCPLWPETVAALRAALAERRAPRREEAGGLVFISPRGGSCVSGGLANAVGKPFTKLLKRQGLHHASVGFYTLRHVFRTVADAARDSVAIDLIMGHSDPSMGGKYRERIEDGRLLAVAEHVRKWLFGGGEGRNGLAGQTAETEAAAPHKVKQGTAE
jgi:integrase